MMIARIVKLMMLTLMLAACAAPTEIMPTSSPSPGPTVTTLPTESLSNAPAPFTTQTPIIVIEDPWTVDTPTPNPPAINLPLEKVSIERPGPGSQVTSPIRVRGHAGPSFQNRVELRLIGEDGREITNAFTYLLATPGNIGPFSTELLFETPLVAEAARLEVRNYHREDGKLDHMGSVDLILLTVGNPVSHFGIYGAEKLHLITPREGQIVEGGVIMVTGAGWVDADVPLHVEVLDHADNIVGSAEVYIEPRQVGRLGTFEVQVLYQVEITQYGRIAVYEPSTTIPGMIHYTSARVLLKP
ncbi:MAG: hypothetical protein GTO18_07955 [Anaerolineales bacterium]|nr:hypothetical protein [Anaerolineales bacterium]